MMDVIDQISARLAADASFALKAIYAKPIGRDDNDNVTYDRILSIHTAAAIAEACGYYWRVPSVRHIDKDTVQIHLKFTDPRLRCTHEHTSEVSLRQPADRLKAQAAKWIRKMILRSVPPPLLAALMEAAEKQIDALLDDSTVSKIIANFANKGVTQEMLEALIGRTKQAGWTVEDRRNLVGLWNALEAGEITL